VSEDDIDQNEARRTHGADNDVFSTDFISKMHPNFRSPVPVQSCDQEDMINSELQEDAPQAGAQSSVPNGTPDLIGEFSPDGDDHREESENLSKEDAPQASVGNPTTETPTRCYEPEN
jgi:hypothetical protein